MNSVIVFLGHGTEPRRIYLDLNAMLDDIRKQYPGATVDLENDKKHGRHCVRVSGVRSQEFGMNWVGMHRLEFRVVKVADPENWGRE